MTYLDYIVHFNRMDQRQTFSASATRLYIKLVDMANGMRDTLGGLPAEFAKSGPYVAAVCGYSKNTMKKARKELEARGLLSVLDPEKEGRGATSIYRLLANIPSGDISRQVPDNVPNRHNNKGSNSAPLPIEKGADSDPINNKGSNSDPLTAEKGSEKGSDFAPLYIEVEKKEVKGAAVAASPTPSSADKKPKGKASKKTEAVTPADLAAVTLPHDGPELAQLWATFCAGPKQAKKPLSAFELMAKKLGKYAEGFAVVMLEEAIQGNWSGVENPGTAEKYTRWQAQEAQRPTAPPPAPVEALPINQEFVNQQQAAEQAARTARFNRFAETATVEQ